MARANRTGRTKGWTGRFFAIPHKVLMSPGYSGLSCTARSTLVEIGSVYNGSNNGRLAMSVRTIAERCNIGRDTASRAIQELEDAGLIETVKKGSFRQHHRKASEYRLTWKRCDVTHALPADKYLRH